MNLSLLKKNVANIKQLSKSYTGKILVAGLLGIAWYNWRIRKRDKFILQQKVRHGSLPPLENWPELPMVSALVAAWNEEKNIQQLIDSFLRLRYPNKEMVLCAGGKDLTYFIASKYSGPQVIVLQQLPKEGKQRALKRCLRQASGQLIYLTDADCIINSDSFEKLVYPIIAGESVSTGVSHPKDNQYENLFVRNQWAQRRYLEIKNQSKYGNGLLGRNCALKRSMIEQAWDTEEFVPTGTDYYLALRVRMASQRIFIVPESSVGTIFPEFFSHYVRQQSRWLKNLLLLGYRYNDSHHVYHVLITSFTGITLLAMPIMPLLIGNLGFITWMVSWAAIVSNRVHYMEMLNCINEERKTIISIELFKILFGDWFAWAKILVDILNPVWRKRW